MNYRSRSYAMHMCSQSGCRSAPGRSGSWVYIRAVLQDIIVGGLTGFVLWTVLPRGVVLTRAYRARDLADEPLYDTWELKNDSAIPVQLVSVAMQSPETMDKQGVIHWRELPTLLEDVHGIDVRMDDEQLGYKSQDGDKWRGFIVPPGDTMQVQVTNLKTLRIRYRRAGWLGIFERREIRIHGGA